jgi:uncharacterized protein YbjT (DUF2867 family)
MKIVVIGGTGLIGSKTVAILRQGGHDVVAASPKSGVNTITGKGLKEAMAGAQVAIDLANSSSFEDKAVLEFFETSGRNLLAAEAAGRPAPRRAVHRRNRPDRQWLFPRQTCPGETGRGLGRPLHHHPRDPVSGIPRRHRRFKRGWKHRQASARPVPLFQPIAADDVAAVVAEVALAAPRNSIVEIAGPERVPFNEIVARYLKAVGDNRQVVRDPEARYFGGRVEERSLVPLGEARLGRIGLDEWFRRSRAGA